MNVVARQLGVQFSQAAARSGLTRSHWTTIATVARWPGGTQREIAALMQISEVSAGRLIEKLAGEGLLRREPSASDRRAFLVHVTDKAQPILAELGEIASRCEERAFAGIDPADLELVVRILGQIEVNLNANGD